MNILYLLVGLVVLHVCLVFGTLLANNLTSTTPDYGGATGFLPSSGDPESAYDKATAFLLGTNRPQSPETEGGGLSLFRWAIKAPFCTTADGISAIIGLTTLLGYQGVIDLLPDEGFGLWIKLLLHLAGTIATLILAGKAIGFLLASGVFSNVYLLVGLGIIGGLAGIAGGLVFGQVISC